MGFLRCFIQQLLLTHVILGRISDTNQTVNYKWLFTDPDMDPSEDAAIVARLKVYTERIYAREYENLIEWRKSIGNWSTSATQLELEPMNTSKTQIKRSILGDLDIQTKLRNRVATGISGKLHEALKKALIYEDIEGSGCKWTGYAPFCRSAFICPSDYDYIRSHSGRCSTRLFATQCIPDQSFGKACFNFFGTSNKKNFCCKSAQKSCTWDGRWMSAKLAYNIYCNYNSKDTGCGEITCLISNKNTKIHEVSKIYGKRCDLLKMFEKVGKMTCGLIGWFDEKSNLYDAWYKAT